MLNIIWIAAVVISTVFMILAGGVEGYTSLVSDGAKSATELIISLAGIMAVWGGIMEIAEQSGITAVIAKMFSPILSRLFPDIKNDAPSKHAVSMNMTANLLGLGNAATPLGIEAMQRLDALAGKSGTASDAMVTFVLINTASIQLIPATTAVLRAQYGAAEPLSILPAVLCASVCALAVGLIFDRLLRRGVRC